MTNGTIKTVLHNGNQFEFHRVGGAWKLLWSNAWETVDVAAKELGWSRSGGGLNSWGHVEYVASIE